MAKKLNLNLTALEVETFRTGGIPKSVDALFGSEYTRLPQVPSTSPCLNSEQTCDSRCWA